MNSKQKKSRFKKFQQSALVRRVSQPKMLGGVIFVLVVAVIGVGTILYSFADTTTQMVGTQAPGFTGETALAPNAANTASVAYSQAWSGYMATGNTFKRVHGTLRVPVIDCTNTHNQKADPLSFWVGLDNGTSSDKSIEQIGFDVFCSGTKEYVQPWWEMFPATTHQIPLSSFSPQPDDNIDATVEYTGIDQTLQVENFTLTLHNKRTGRYWSTKPVCKIGACARSTAEWVVEELHSFDYAGAALPPVLSTTRTLYLNNNTATVNTIDRPITYFNNTKVELGGPPPSPVYLVPSSITNSGQNFTINEN